MSTLDFSTKIGSKRFSNPIFTASGCASSGQELSQFFPLTELGAIVTKSIMTKSRTGRLTPRMAETPSGMLNSIGLQGPGIDAFLENDIPWLVEQKAKIIVSIAGETVDEYGVLSRRLRAISGISAVEVNISCPNVENRGQVFACHPDTSVAVIEAVRRNIGGELPIIAKLSPDVTDIVEIAAAVINAGVDGLALINTLLGMVIDTKTLKPKLSGKTGGLSGPAIRPVAVRCVYQIRQALPKIPIIGMGGIRTGNDALEFFAAGANAISVGTMVFNDPEACVRIHDEVCELLNEKSFRSINDVVNAAHKEQI